VIFPFSGMLYNPLGAVYRGFHMQALRHLRLSERGWRGALIGLAMCSLTLSVVTRFCLPDGTQAHIVKSADQRPFAPKRQHLDQDAARWVAPSSYFTLIEPAAIEVSLPSAGPVLPTHVFSDILYNRPPPSSALPL